MKIDSTRSNKDTEVVLVYRKPLPSAHSIEYLFHSLFAVLQQRITIRERKLPYFNKGVVPRLLNILSLISYRKRIVHITGDCYYAILGALFAKRVITVHDLSFLDRTSGLSRAVLKLFWVSLPTRLAHQITVVSNRTKEVLIKEANVSADKIKVIHNFIDPIYQPVTRTFNCQKPRILQVGTAFNKNLLNLVAAIKGISCRLVIIGKLNEVQKSALNANNIDYENYFFISTTDLHQQYIQADLLTFVSTVEGFGMPILEAQATGLPVITSNCSSMPEIAADGALLVNPLDPDSIRKGILELITDRQGRESRVAAGFRNVQRFSKEKVAADYQAVYQSLHI